MTSRDTVLLHLRRQELATDETGHTKWTVIEETKAFPVGEVAVVVVDIWDQGGHGTFEENGRFFGCYSAYKYHEWVSKAINATLEAVRRLGIQVVFAPSGQTQHYEDHPVRKNMRAIPHHDPPWEGELGWNEGQREIPFSDYDNEKGCYCHRDADDLGLIPLSCPRPPGAESVGQHPNLMLHQDDLMTESPGELWNLIQERAIEMLIYMGGATNMCLPGRPFGLLSMKEYGLNVVFDRNPDHLIHRVPDGWNGDPHNPEFGPKFAKQNRWREIVEYYERYICPTIDGDMLIAGS